MHLPLLVDHSVQLLLTRLLMVPTDRTSQLLAPRDRHQRDEAEREEVSSLPGDHRVVVAPRAHDPEVLVALEVAGEVLRAAN